MIYTGPLSKWWTTQSCKDAYARAEQRKKDAIKKMVETARARKEQLDKEVSEWDVVDAKKAKESNRQRRINHNAGKGALRKL